MCDHDADALLVACTTCQAAVGAPCTRAHDRAPRHPHRLRVTRGILFSAGVFARHPASPTAGRARQRPFVAAAPVGPDGAPLVDGITDDAPRGRV
ncbi:hypothetical protein tb265_38840 [Gemmatimonadetes bacterium T265]|nr:hypothetical protein tb265_38840 [Gemmatimonadetes bacterium T265]